LIGYGSVRKWVPKTISAIYYDGEKERYYIKRFLVETENKEELIITLSKFTIGNCINRLPSGSWS
jgi:hypothetical protein